MYIDKVPIKNWMMCCLNSVKKEENGPGGDRETLGELIEPSPP